MSANAPRAPLLSVVIVAYNSARELPECVASVQAQTSTPLEVLVVDNASADRSAEVAEALVGPAQVDRSQRNVGFAAACNRAAQLARGRMLLFLNPDTVIRDGAVDRACALLEADPTIGVVGARTLYADGTVNRSSCFREPSLFSFAFEAVGANTLFRRSAIANREGMGSWDRSDTRDVDVVAGCFFMIRADLFRSLGGFDERFFMYSEDVDLSHRVREAGKRCVHYADATIVHEGGRSDNVRAEKRAKVYAGRALYVHKHWPPWRARAAVASMSLAVLVRVLGAAVARDSERRRRLRDTWRLRALWRTAATRTAVRRSDHSSQLELSAQPVTAGRLIEPRPWRNRGRLAIRWTRFVFVSLRAGYADFARSGVTALGRLVRYTLADLTPLQNVRCNLCGWSGRHFYDNVGPGYDERDTSCPGCLSQDRHRSLVALLASADAFTAGQRIVEVAPMRGFERLLLSLPVDYTSFDISRHAMERGDVTAMRFAADSVDTVIAMHVLEHLPDDRRALDEMIRVLRPGGEAVLQVPVDWQRARTAEYPGPDPRDVGHVRVYGRDFVARLAERGFEVDPRSVEHRFGEREIRRFGLSTEPIFFARKPATKLAAAG